MQLFVNRVTTMDFSYLDCDRGLLGESWYVDVSIEGQTDDQGMILDFADIKKQIKRTIDQQFDHRLLIPANHAGLEVAQIGDLESITFKLSDNNIIVHNSPPEAISFIDANEITPDKVAQTVKCVLKSQLPENVESITLRFYPEDTKSTWYQYSHGLKKHCGNCQRIAHGHRSKITILRNGKPDPSLDKHWAETFKDIYIATREDLQEEITLNGSSYYRFAYTSEQGRFELTLPRTHCYIIDSETTVENIARHIADELSAAHPEDRFEVRAFEGINKGAVCTSGT